MSRIGHEAALTPFLVICGLYAAAASHLITRRADARRAELSLVPLILGAVMLGASARAYASMRVFVPAMAAACCFFYRRRLVSLWRDSGNARRLIVAAVIVLLIWSPMIWTVCADWDRFSGRSLGESLLHKDPGAAVALATIAKQYIGHFGWRWLFTRGDPSPIQSIPGMGQLAWVFLPLMVVGAIRTVRRARRCAGDRVLVAWLLLHPLAAALSHSGAHALRSAVGIGAFSWLAAAGAVELSRWCARLGERLRVACHFVLAIAILINGAVTMRNLTRGSRSRLVRATHQTDTLEAVYRIRRIWRNYDRVFLSDRESAARYWRSDEAYVYVLLGLPVEPAEFQQWPKHIEYASDDEPFHTVRSAGPFVFSTSTETLALQFKEHPHERVLVIARPGDLTGGKILDRVLWPGGELRFEVLEVAP